eukprot:3100826-Prymnesium_polylepis.1
MENLPSPAILMPPSDCTHHRYIGLASGPLQVFKTATDLKLPSAVPSAAVTPSFASCACTQQGE